MSDIQEFPKMLYHKGNPHNYKVVNTADEEEALGEDWIDAPDPEYGDRLTARMPVGSAGQSGPIA